MLAAVVGLDGVVRGGGTGGSGSAGGSGSGSLETVWLGVLPGVLWCAVWVGRMWAASIDLEGLERLKYNVLPLVWFFLPAGVDG